MKYLLQTLLVFLFFQIVSLQGQISSNMNMLDRWDDNSLPLRYGSAFNDIWGYVDPSGNEYALVGSIDGLFIFDVTQQDGESNSAFPVEVDFITGGSSSLWRDMKTYQNYAYMVADEGLEGLTIVDLSGLPNSVSVVLQTTAFFTRAHNIYIDEAAGRLYAVGTNTHSSGVIVLDLSNPANPVEIGDANLPEGYVHDIFVRGDTAYCSQGGDGLFVYDYTNADAPAFLGSITAYPEQGYNHSSWLTDDGNWLVFADETKGKGLKIMDVSNLNSLNVPLSNVFRSTLEAPVATNSIAHNPFIKGDSVYISYYHDGVQVFDISNPAAVTNAAYYDTWPNNTNYSGWDGCWGVYPFLPSGNIIASDQLNGLYVLELAGAPVPVELINWYGSVEKGFNLLHWNTATENNTDFFEVERSRDGLEFSVIGTVAATGTSAQVVDYQLRDETAPAGGSYYRLRMVDQDGSYEYSEIIHLYRREKSGDIIRVYPTIVEGTEGIIINHDLSEEQLADLEIRIIDASGRLLQSAVPFSDQGIYLMANWPDLAAGVYFLNIQGAQTQYVQRIVVQ
jgi:choice-of-anchor B domain-containing protein